MSGDSDREFLRELRSRELIDPRGSREVIDKLEVLIARLDKFYELRAENYEDRPLAVTHHRGLLTGNAEDWRSRDLLIELLRRMDMGETDVLNMVITYEMTSETSSVGTAVSVLVATSDTLKTLGLLTRALHMKAAE